MLKQQLVPGHEVQRLVIAGEVEERDPLGCAAAVLPRDAKVLLAQRLAAGLAAQKTLGVRTDVATTLVATTLVTTTLVATTLRRLSLQRLSRQCLSLQSFYRFISLANGVLSLQEAGYLAFEAELPEDNYLLGWNFLKEILQRSIFRRTVGSAVVVSLPLTE